MAMKRFSVLFQRQRRVLRDTRAFKNNNLRSKAIVSASTVMHNAAGKGTQKMLIVAVDSSEV